MKITATKRPDVFRKKIKILERRSVIIEHNQMPSREGKTGDDTFVFELAREFVIVSVKWHYDKRKKDGWAYETTEQNIEKIIDAYKTYLRNIDPWEEGGGGLFPDEF